MPQWLNSSQVWNSGCRMANTAIKTPAALQKASTPGVSSWGKISWRRRCTRVSTAPTSSSWAPSQSWLQLPASCSTTMQKLSPHSGANPVGSRSLQQSQNPQNSRQARPMICARMLIDAPQFIFTASTAKRLLVVTVATPQVERVSSWSPYWGTTPVS